MVVHMSCELASKSCEDILIINGSDVVVSTHHELLKVVIDNRVHIWNGVYLTRVGHYTLVFDSRDANYIRINNRIIEVDIREGCILVRYYLSTSSSWSRLYCGASGSFDMSVKGIEYPPLAVGRRRLKLSDAELGSASVSISAICYGLVHGYRALLGLGEISRSHDIHHLFGRTHGHGIWNLDLLSMEEHKRVTFYERVAKRNEVNLPLLVFMVLKNK